MLQGGAMAEFAIGQLISEGVLALPPQPETRRYATRTLVTAADDTPAHTPIPGRITGSFSIQREISSGREGRFGGLASSSIGGSEIVLANPDRALDELLAGYTDGRPVRLKIGVIATSETGASILPRYDSMQIAITATAGTFSAERDEIRLRLRDAGLLLQQEIQTQKYTGLGRRGGGPELADLSKPYAIGKCDNVPAQLVDPERLIYQVSTSALGLPFKVYDSGIQVSSPTSVSSYQALESVNVAPGQAAVALPEGFFRLGIMSAGRVTADIRTAPESEVKHTAALIDDILEDVNISTTQRSITSINDADGDEAGYFQPAGSNASIEAVIAELAAATGAVFGADRDGIYRLIWLEASALDAAPTWTFTDRAIIDIERLNLPYGVPWLSWVVGRARNWTVQTADELALSIPSTRRQFLEQEYRTVRTGDPAVLQAHLTSRETELIPTFFSHPPEVSGSIPPTSKDPAIRFANRMAAWYSVDRAMYRIVVKTALCQVELGDIVSISAPLWGLDSGRSFMAVAVTDDLGAVASEITLFG